MALTRITFDVAGERQVSRAFDVLERDAQDLREPLRGVHEHLRQVIGEQFLTEGAHGGSKWRDLSEGYKPVKQERYDRIYPILVASGDMRAALLAREPLELGPRRLVFGIDPSATNSEGVKIADYASAHQSGRGRTPQRKIISLTTMDKRGIDREFVEYFSSRTRRLVGLG